MGKSSTGKDTIYKRIKEDSSLELQTIVPYTTRPIREGEKNGVEYFFTDEAGFQRLSTEGKVIEARSYETFHGVWRYFTVDDGQINPSQKDYILIGTLEVYTKMVETFGQQVMVPILIELDDGERLTRALNREKSQDHPKYEEMCRRFLADSVDFSEEKLEKAGICKRFNNDELSKCIEEICSYIQSMK